MSCVYRKSYFDFNNCSSYAYFEETRFPLSFDIKMSCKTSFLKFFILCIALVSCSAAVCAAVLSMSMQFKKAEVDLTEFGNYIPKHFIIDDSYDSVINSQGERGTSAVFSFISYIEGIFHKFLLSKNEISQSKTVEFSEQAFLAYLAKICKENSKYSDICGKISYGENIDLEDISLPVLIDVINSIPEMKHSLFPKKICPYKSDSGNYECENSLSNNPFTFSLTNLTSVTGVEAIKELLYTTNKPILFTMPMLYSDYYIPCDDERVRSKTECKTGQQTISCPYNRTKKCGKLSFPAKTMSGDFYLPQEPVGISSGYPINFEIVGYSDSYISSRGRARLSSVKISKGGFIVKGTNKEEGYPLMYLAGELRLSTALSQCPNNYASQYWYGPLLGCMLKYNNVTKCSAKAEAIDDDSETKFKESNGLVCIDSKYCEEGKEYFVTHQPVRTYETVVYEEESGMTLTKLVKYDESGSKEVNFNQVPFYRLGSVFADQDPYRDDIMCGYGFLPYDVVEKATEVSKDVGAHVLAISADVEFSESSIPSKMPQSEYTSMFQDYSRLHRRKLTNYNLPNK